jgi:bacteriocin-like protein
MRNLSINELNEVQGGRMTVSLGVTIIGLISDAYTLVEAALKVDYQGMVNDSTVDYGGYNAMGDYTNGICTR